ncbi:PASTA domain-containing protein, partial [bacterium]|nr:PASTA domain-containing protein [bacterium]
MDDGGATQLLERTEAPLSEGAGTPPPPGAQTTGGTRGGFPKRWIALIAVAVVLLAAVIGVLLLTGDNADETASAEVAVPDLRGMTLERAGEEVLGAGLVPGTVQYAVVEESVTPSGTVLSQEPLPGALVAPGSALNIVLARGAAPITQVETPDAPGNTATSDSSSSSGSAGSSTPPPPESQPVLPDLPPMETIDPGLLQ